jgi:hypothetical protein
MSLVFFNPPPGQFFISIVQIIGELLFSYQQTVSFYPITIQQMFVRMRAHVVPVFNQLPDCFFEIFIPVKISGKEK